VTQIILMIVSMLPDNYAITVATSFFRHAWEI